MPKKTKKQKIAAAARRAHLIEHIANQEVDLRRDRVEIERRLADTNDSETKSLPELSRRKSSEIVPRSLKQTPQDLRTRSYFFKDLRKSLFIIALIFCLVVITYFIRG